MVMCIYFILSICWICVVVWKKGLERKIIALFFAFFTLLAGIFTWLTQTSDSPILNLAVSFSIMIPLAVDLGVELSEACKTKEYCFFGSKLFVFSVFASLCFAVIFKTAMEVA